MKIIFRKYQGTGNDFIIIDNRKLQLKFSKKQISHWCNRRFGIGADGLMLVNNDENTNFKMIYYNADGKESSMCGNGGRCIVKCVFDLGLKTKNIVFSAIDGIHQAQIINNDVLLSMANVSEIHKKKLDFELNTGSPHYVAFKHNIDKFDLVSFARNIRYSKLYASANGINVNIVEPIKSNFLKVRTYERGVEDETYSCGTGVVASVLAFAIEKKIQNGNHKTQVSTQGGNLEVSFHKQQNVFQNIVLRGKATFVFEGSIFHKD